MKSDSQKQTAGQLERTIAQSLHAFYKKQIGQSPSKITCQFFETKLGIVIEDSITKPELLMLEADDTTLVEQVRRDINSVIQLEIKSLISQILQLEARDVLIDTSIKTGTTGIVVSLSGVPNVRNVEAIPKAIKRKQNTNQGESQHQP
ncbi:MAG: DUF2294 domain-containing protein [Cyanobacteria bacterium J06614_10]